MRSPVGYRSLPHVIELVKHIVRVVVVPEYEGVVYMSRAILGWEIPEDPDWQDVDQYQEEEG